MRSVNGMIELEFDKEIDALLRRQAVGRTITIGEFAGVHLDADEIASFVENAVPATTRNSFVRHFAGCDPCRRALNHAITLHNSEPELADGIAAPEVEKSVPWYRRLFLFPNLAYVMGGLIVVFAGFIGLSVYRSGGGQLELSKASSKSAPAVSEAEPEQSYAANSNAAQPIANTMSNAANTAATAEGGFADSTNTAANSVAHNKGPSPETEIAASDDEREETRVDPPPAAAPPAKEREKNISIDGVDAKRADKAAGESRRVEEYRPEPKAGLRDRAKSEDRKAPADMAPSTQNSRVMQSAPMTAKGPSVQRNDSRNSNERQNAQPSRAREADSALKSVARKKDAGGTSTAAYAANAPKKQVSGKNFEFRSGVWYDSTYRGQGTVNVRRSSPGYKKLDGGLRSIADTINGTVVTVWNGTAYRID